jgi:LPS sulfotransferase NodH
VPTIQDEFPDLAAMIQTGRVPACCAKPVIFIAMTPRTGSTHLCDVLATDQRIGPGLEAFNPRGWLKMEKAKRNVASFAAYIDSFNRDPADYVLIKTPWMDFQFAAGFYRHLFSNLTVLYLDRRDVVAQAVSLSRALIRQKWHVMTGDPAAEDLAAVDAQFDLAGICRIIDGFKAEKRDWEAFFAREGIDPPRLFYEDFADDAGHAVKQVGAVLGMKLQCDPAAARWRRLADGLSLEWAARVRRHLAAVQPA